MGVLDLQVNRDGGVPVGTQLAWQIQALIVNGHLLPGEQLPSVRRLAEVAGVNVNTVRSVYELLIGMTSAAELKTRIEQLEANQKGKR